MNKKFGFTLAEVLITLGIIGVVAAMPIPTLIANTNSAKFRSQFKKSISTLNQAGLMAQAQYAVDYAAVRSFVAADDTLNYFAEDNTGTTTLVAILNSTLVGASITDYADYGATGPDGTAALAHGVPDDGKGVMVKMADGSMVVFDRQANNCTKPINNTISAYAASGDPETVAAHCEKTEDGNTTTIDKSQDDCNGAGET